MSKKTIQKVIYAVVVVLLLLGSFFAGQLLNKPMNVQAQEITGDETRAIVFNCNIDNVAIYSNRAHIRCTNFITVGSNTVRYFAIANTNENEMFINRVMAIGLTNMSMNRYVEVWFDTLASNNPSGCQPGDCRKLYAVNGHK